MVNPLAFGGGPPWSYFELRRLPRLRTIQTGLTTARLSPFIRLEALRQVWRLVGRGPIAGRHGAPAPPQLHACGPVHGWSGWFSQTQPVSSQSRHFMSDG